MNAKFLFNQFPDADSCWVSGNDAFLKESEAVAYAKHFNTTYSEVSREEITGNVAGHNIKILSPVMETAATETEANLGVAIANQLSKKDEAKVEAIKKAESKAKEESEAKAQADADAKAKAESEAKAQADADAKAKAESETKASVVTDVP